MNLALFLAYKYISYPKKDSTIRLMMRVSFFGILIGTFSLMLTLIIFNGFEETIHEKMQGINAQIILHVPDSRMDPDKLRQSLIRELKDKFVWASGSITRQLILDNGEKQTLIFIRGLEPESEAKVTTLESKITSPANSNLEKMLSNNSIIVGHKLAQSFGLKVGNKVDLLIPEYGQSKNKISLRKKSTIVSGIFNVGLDEYDNGIAFCSIDFINKIFAQDEEMLTGVEEMAIRLNKTTQEEDVIKELKKQFPGTVIESWKELYPALVSSLKLEKYVMFFIIALISLVASMSMVSLLFVQLQQKRRDIAILLSMGANINNIKNIFMILGLLITLLGSIIGLSLAAISGFLLEKYPFIELPDVYYVSHLPARMNWEIFVIVFISAFALGLFATWLPTKNMNKIKIAELLRSEG